MPKPLISVVGSINIDFTTVVPRHPGPGETLRAKSFSANAGGKGANQACACGRASFAEKQNRIGTERRESGFMDSAISNGAVWAGENCEPDVEVELIGAVGADEPFYASLVKPMLEGSGVSLRGVEEARNVSTGTATVIVDEDSGENRIMIVPGANFAAMSDADKLIRKMATRRRPDVVVLQGEIPRETVQEIIADRKGLLNGTKTIWNAAPVFDEMIPWDVWKKLYTLVVNETELVQIAKVQGGFDGLLERAENERKQLSRELLGLVCRCFHEKGPAIIIVTLGARGSFYSFRRGDAKHAEIDLDFVPASTVQHVVDTTAAGDTFVGYLAVALARWVGRGEKQSFDIRTGLATASAAAALCVQQPGAMASIPWAHEV